MAYASSCRLARSRTSTTGTSSLTCTWRPERFSIPRMPLITSLPLISCATSAGAAIMPISIFSLRTTSCIASIPWISSSPTFWPTRDGSESITPHILKPFCWNRPCSVRARPILPAPTIRTLSPSFRPKTLEKVLSSSSISYPRRETPVQSRCDRSWRTVELVRPRNFEISPEETHFRSSSCNTCTRARYFGNRRITETGITILILAREIGSNWGGIITGRKNLSNN